MTQNIYDTPDFFAAYSRLRRSVEGLDGAAEWPTIRAMLPDLRNQAVVDLGCGFGWFCRWAREQGASRVLGLDVSENMLARAEAGTADQAISYARADLEQFTLPPAGFGLAYSSLALHYIENLDGLFETIWKALVPGGELVFSIEHPMCTAPSNPGWVDHAAGYKTWPVDHYSIEGPRVTDWLAKGVIKQHRTIAHYLNALLRHGFAIRRVEEWAPDDAQITARPELAIERESPPFLLLRATRESGP